MVAALVSMANGIWVVATGAYWASVFPNNGDIQSLPSHEYNLAVLVIGIVLLLDSAVCFLNWSRAFYASAGISTLIVLGEVMYGAQGANPAAFVGGLALAALTIGLDLVAARTRNMISEADHPLNLPVFG